MPTPGGGSYNRAMRVDLQPWLAAVERPLFRMEDTDLWEMWARVTQARLRAAIALLVLMVMVLAGLIVIRLAMHSWARMERRLREQRDRGPHATPASSAWAAAADRIADAPAEPDPGDDDDTPADPDDDPPRGGPGGGKDRDKDGGRGGRPRGGAGGGGPRA